MGTSIKDCKPPTDAEIHDYFQILKSDPRSRVFAPLAEALVRRGRLDEAEQLCRYGLEHNPNFSDGHLACSRILFHRRRYTEALDEVKITLGLDAGNVEAYLMAAQIYLAQAQHKAASGACLKVLDIDPENAAAMQLLQRLGAGQSPQRGPRAPQPTARNFKASAATSPGLRRPAQGVSPSASDTFGQLMQDLQDEASQRIEDEDQPFTALSSGSQPPPSHPQPRAREKTSTREDTVQTVIDSYRDRSDLQRLDDGLPLRVPRLGTMLLPLLQMLALLTGIVVLILFLVRP